jgi:predicted phage-related endonuclease
MIDLGAGLILPEASRLVRYRFRLSWLHARPSFLGASEAAKLLHLSAWGADWSVYMAKHFPRFDDKPTRAQARGHREEPRILEDHASATGNRVLGPLGLLVVYGKEPWMACTPDAFERCWDSWGVAEAKTDTTPFRWGKSTIIEEWSEEASSIVREDYACQVYYQLACTGLEWGNLIVKRHLDDQRCYTLVRDPKLEAHMLGRIGAWWQKHIVEGEQPLLDDSDACAAALARLYPATDPTMVEADPEVEELFARRAELKTAVKACEDELRGIDNNLKSRIEGRKGYTFSPESALGRWATLVRRESGATYWTVK